MVEDLRVYKQMIEAIKFSISNNNVESDLRDISFGGGNTEEPQEQIPTELLNPVGTTTPTTPTAPTTPTTPTIPVDTRVPASVITLSDSTVKEGNQITITATVTVNFILE